MKLFWRLSKAMRKAVELRRSIRGPKRPSWDPTYETLALVLHHYSKRSLWLPLAVQRRASEGLLAGAPIVRACFRERLLAHGVKAERLRHESVSSKPRYLLYLHGGGYSIGSLKSHRHWVARLSKVLDAEAYAIDYRLAPEHPFPAQLQDAVAAYRFLVHEQKIDPARLVVAGESAGGGLTVSLLVELLRLGEVLPACAFVISPWVDLRMTAASIDANEPFDFVSRPVLEAFARRFVSASDRSNPMASPVLADLSGLPPLLIHAGEAECLRDDAAALAQRAKDCQVEVESEIFEDMIHAWHLFGPLIGEYTDPAIAAIERFVAAKVP